MKFFGHIVRKEKYEFLVVSGKREEKRGRGRLRHNMGKQVKDFTGLSIGELCVAARDRQHWRGIVHENSKAWSRHGT